jgi:hypothetical protein
MTVPEGTTKETVHPSRFMKAADLNSENPVYTVTDTNLEIIGEKNENKCVISFLETTKELVLNATNWSNLEKIYGTDPNGWIGKRIELFSTWVDFRGQSVEAVRIKPEIPTREPAPPPQPETIP